MENKVSITKKIVRKIPTIISLPFIFCLVLIRSIFVSFKVTVQFAKYGGEFSVYEKDDMITIRDIYNHLKKKRND